MRLENYDVAERKLRAILVERRNRLGLTQAQLGKMLGKSQQFVSKYETGERKIDAVELVLIAKALNLSTSHILRRVGDL